MTLAETFALIAMVMTILTAAGVLFLVVSRRGRDVGDDLEAMHESIRGLVETMHRDLTKHLYETMSGFNETINRKLGEHTEKSGKTITEFRLNVNEQLASFQKKMDETLKKDFDSLASSIDGKMSAINEKVEERLSKGFRDTNETFVKIAERVKVIDSAQEKIKALSTEMVSLQNILSNNQKRGQFGEFQLNQLLYSVFGENKALYDTQHTIKVPGRQHHVRADAVVFMPKPHHMIAIDSKFPFSAYAALFKRGKAADGEDEKALVRSFGRDVKKHITDIANKYIIPGVTAEYALMFVPSDGILSFIHSHLGNVLAYAREKYVTLVSPTTLVPLMSSLNTVMLDYERSAHMKDIGEQLTGLKKDFDKLSSSWRTLNKSIVRLGKQSESVDDRVGRITTRFNDIHELDFLSGSDGDVDE